MLSVKCKRDKGSEFKVQGLGFNREPFLIFSLDF